MVRDAGHAEAQWSMMLGRLKRNGVFEDASEEFEENGVDISHAEGITLLQQLQVRLLTWPNRTL